MKSKFSESTLSPITAEEQSLIVHTKNKNINSKPKMPIPTPSVLNLMDSKDIENAEYDDDAMNKYMEKLQNQ